MASWCKLTSLAFLITVSCTLVLAFSVESDVSVHESAYGTPAGQAWCASASTTASQACDTFGDSSSLCNELRESVHSCGGSLGEAAATAEDTIGGRFGRRRSRQRRSRHRCNRAKCNDANCSKENRLDCPTMPANNAWWGNGDLNIGKRFGEKFGYKEDQLSGAACSLQKFLDEKDPQWAVFPLVGHYGWGPGITADSKGLNVKAKHITCTSFDNAFVLESKAICNPTYGAVYTLKDRPVFMCSRAGVIAPLNQYKLKHQCCDWIHYDPRDGSCRQPSAIAPSPHGSRTKMQASIPHSARSKQPGTFCRNAIVVAKYNLCVAEKKAKNDGTFGQKCHEYKFAKCYQCRNYIGGGQGFTGNIGGGQGFTGGMQARVQFIRNCKDPKPCGTGMNEADTKILMQNIADQVTGF